MSSETDLVKAIFLEACEKSDSERAEFLSVACQGDAPLRQQVERLLAAHAEEDSLFDRTDSFSVASANAKSSQTIGPYKLLQQIGEGGMGVVYLAEQLAPVKRTVALKLVRAGVDSKQIVARFEAERQSLALMDHPNIAKVLDAGTTAEGAPYFVMELVKGVPINEYCDANRLRTNERIRLMRDVCHAVQHAHQKGIIHRDLKPSNILVAQYDDRPVPKVIDLAWPRLRTRS